jgi:DNA (cytosine-5)-methyltransferase 1
MRRFVFEHPDPFILKVNHGVNTKGERIYSVHQPLTTITATSRAHALAIPSLVPMQHNNRARGVDDPVQTITGQGNKFMLLSAFMAKHFGGVVGNELRQPTSTVTSKDHHALTSAHLVKFRGDCVGTDMREPIHTVAANGLHVGEVRAFLTKYYSTGAVGQSLRDPAHTLRAKQCLGLVTVAGVDYQVGDIGMRMLDPHELLAAQFGEYSRSYDISAARTKTNKVRLIGNSVCPDVAFAIVQANCAEARQEVAA